MRRAEAIELDNIKIINMHEAKTHLSSLVDKAVAGEPFVIAKSGAPQVVVYAYQEFSAPVKRTGFMPEIEIPDDFDTLCQEEIIEQFGAV